MNNINKIIFYTIKDLMRQKSFYVLLGISIFFVLLIRGCYRADFSLNGEALDNVALAWHTSLVAFHLIVYGMFLMAAMLAMNIFSRDREDGSTVLFLSRPVARWQYVLGRICGTWILCSGFMIILHFTIFIITWLKTGGIIPGYFIASLICSINLLWVVILVSLLSLYMPDFIAAITVLGIVGLGFISDSIFLAMQSEVVQSALSGKPQADPALWRIFFPKISMLQHYAVSFITNSEFHSMGPIHPLMNLFLYLFFFAVLLVVCFNRKEI